MRAVTFLEHFYTNETRKRTFYTCAVTCAVGLAWTGTALAQNPSPGVRFPPPSPPPKPLQSTRPATLPTVATPAPAPKPVIVPTQKQTTVQPEPVAPPSVTPQTQATVPPATVPPSTTAAWPPAVLPYREGMPIAPGYRLESEMRTGLVVGGLLVLAVPYVTGIIAAAASDFTRKSGWLALPLAGPFIAMGGRSIDCNFTDNLVSGGDTTFDVNQEEDDCRNSALSEARVVALLTVSGLMQTAGAIITIAGLASRDNYLIRKDLSQEPVEEQPQVTVDGGYDQGRVRLTARFTF